MSLEVSISGAATLKQVAARIRAEGRKDLSREMGKALADATEPVKTSLRREYATNLPSSGGYASLFAKSLRHRISRRQGGQVAQVILATYADATSERRDIQALERGSLRHPVYGRSRRVKVGVRAGTIITNSWAVTPVRGKFHERGTANAADEAQGQLSAVIDDFAARLIK